MNRLVVCVPEIIFLLGERLKNFLFPTNTFENRLSLRMKKGNIEQSLGLCKTEVLLVRKQCREVTRSTETVTLDGGKVLR